MFFFFFFKQKTAYEMRISDWSSDVCSSDLTMRFVPSYNKENLLPWDIIVVDEAGMCGLDLWHLIWAACKPTTRIFLVGDIQQLPPTHGKSIFGFAMANWPTWELTHVHRQQGVNNSIVEDRKSTRLNS